MPPAKPSASRLQTSVSDSIGDASLDRDRLREDEASYSSADDPSRADSGPLTSSAARGSRTAAAGLGDERTCDDSRGARSPSREEGASPIGGSRQGRHAEESPPLVKQQSDRGMNPGQYMRGLAAEARAWGARALSGSGGGRGGASGWQARNDVDPVTLLLPETAQRVGGPAGRGPLLRRLQTYVPGMMMLSPCIHRSCGVEKHEPRGMMRLAGRGARPLQCCCRRNEDHRGGLGP